MTVQIPPNVAQRLACMKPTVAARIVRLNPVFDLGRKIRGLYTKPMSWRRAKKKMQAGQMPDGPVRTPDGVWDWWFMGLPSDEDLKRWKVKP